MKVVVVVVVLTSPTPEPLRGQDVGGSSPFGPFSISRDRMITNKTFTLPPVLHGRLNAVQLNEPEEAVEVHWGF